MLLTAAASVVSRFKLLAASAAGELTVRFHERFVGGDVLAKYE
jgi:hypothetical protein